MITLWIFFGFVCGWIGNDVVSGAIKLATPVQPRQRLHRRDDRSSPHGGSITTSLT